MEKRAIVVMPAYNATKTIESVFDRITEGAYGRIFEFIIVNDGSIDDTPEVVERLMDKYGKISWLNHPWNRGYGAAQKTGYIQAVFHKADIVVMLHSDGQYAPELLLDMIKPIEEGKADVVAGSRYLGGEMKKNMPKMRYYGNRFLTQLENLIFGMNITTYHSGYKAYSRNALQKIPFEKYSDNFWFDSEMMIGAKRNNLKIVEIPIPTRYAEEKSYLNPIPYGIGVLGVIIRYLIGGI